jgi:flagellar secretion chaperone FliS
MQAHARAANAYKRADLDSAPKPIILERLFERFLIDLSRARDAITAKDIQGKASHLDHAMRIVGELEASLDHAVAPELCANLAALYRFVLEQLTTCNRTLDPSHLDAAARVMGDLGAAFREAHRK